MLFNSLEFIYLFLPLSLLFFYWLPNHRLKLLSLFIFSYIFYGYWNYKFISLLLLSTAIDYYVGLRMSQARAAAHRKLLLQFSIIINLSILGFFKYFNFFLENANEALGLFSLSSLPVSALEVILPVGISFYTFQSMSYTIDLYYNKTKPHKDFLAFATYVALFPQLVAGPIVRHDQLVPQLNNRSIFTFNWVNFSRGIVFFSLGLGKKVLIADRISAAIDPALANLAHLSTTEAWLCILGYTTQLYFDFSGYSDMAVGLGSMLNLKFPQNFNSPYKSKSITEFWQRWHISLSTWLRDYLYIPLGGNRTGRFMTYRNLLITMFLGGLWHGAAWVFVLWGAYHGLLLAFERFVNKRRTFKPSMFSLIKTFFLVNMGWVLFRSPNLEFAMDWYRKLFVWSGQFSVTNFSSSAKDSFFIMLFVGMILIFVGKNTFEMERHGLLLTKKKAFFLAIVVVIATMDFATKSPFLYFQF